MELGVEPRPLDSLTDRPLCFPYVQVCLKTRQKPKTRIASYEQGRPGFFLHAANIISNFLRRKKVRSQLLFLYFCCTFADENLAKSHQICEIVPLDLSVRCLKLLVFFPFVSSSGIFFYGAPTPPLTQQQSTDNKVRVNVGLGER